MSDSEMQLRKPATHCVLIGEPEWAYPATNRGSSKTHIDATETILAVSIPLTGYSTIKLPTS